MNDRIVPEWMEAFATFVEKRLPIEPYEWLPVCIGYCHARQKNPKPDDFYFSFLESAHDIKADFGTEEGLKQLQLCFRKFWRIAAHMNDEGILKKLITFVIYRWGGLGQNEDEALKRSERLLKHFDLKSDTFKFIDMNKTDRFDLVALSKIAAWINPEYQIYDSRVSFALNALYREFNEIHSQYPKVLPLPLASRRMTWPEEFKNCRRMTDREVNCSFYGDYLKLLRLVKEKSNSEKFSCETKIEQALFMFGKKELDKYSTKRK